MICFHACKSADVLSIANIEGRMIESQSNIKMLGFHFSTTPTVKLHVEKTIEKFNRALWSIVHLKKAGLNDITLVNVYKCMLRSLLEYSSNVFYSMLTEDLSNRLERCQRRALTVIYGFGIGYLDLLILSSLEKLSVRRESLFKKFCLKMSNSERFSRKWLPKYDTDSKRTLRNSKIYIEFNAATDRLFNSPEFKMRRTLNQMLSGR